MIAFGANISPHGQIPKDSRWRHKRSRKEWIVVASSATHVLYRDDVTFVQGSRTMGADRWLAGYERIDV